MLNECNTILEIVRDFPEFSFNLTRTGTEFFIRVEHKETTLTVRKIVSAEELSASALQPEEIIVKYMFSAVEECVAVRA